MKTKMKTIHFRVPDSLDQQIQWIKDLTDASSQTMVLRDALSVYTWVLSQLEEGRQVHAVGADDLRISFSTPGMQLARTKTGGTNNGGNRQRQSDG